MRPLQHLVAVFLGIISIVPVPPVEASPATAASENSTATHVSSLLIAAAQQTAPLETPSKTQNGTVIKLLTNNDNPTLEQSFLNNETSFNINTRPWDSIPTSPDEKTLLRILNEESVLKKRRKEQDAHAPVSEQISRFNRRLRTPLVKRARAKLMIVGDSISQGMEGDWTWRYRLWQWLDNNKEDFEFVGPWTGTRQPPDPANPPSKPHIDGDPLPDTPPVVSGGYAEGVNSRFEKSHFALWGRQASQTKGEIKQMVEKYQPTHLLVLLGFNDLGWFVTGPDGTLASIKSIVDNARAANPNINIILGDVVQRSSLGFRADLPIITDEYNGLLKNAVPKWNTEASPVAMAYIRDIYSCETQACPSGHDGLHPNARGEYQIAYAFSLALFYGFGIGKSTLSIPTIILGRYNPVPTNVVASASPYGITVTWDKVYGARKYGVRSRYKGLTTWNEGTATTNRIDNTWVIKGSHFEYQIRVDNEVDGTSDWSQLVEAVAAPKTIGGPSVIHSLPTETGAKVSWSAVEGAEFYVALLFDSDLPGAWLSVVGVKGLSYTWESQYVGHRHVVAVQAWNSIGGGLPALGKTVVPGTAGVLPAPTNLYINSVDATTVQLSWCGGCQDTSYKLHVRSLNTALTDLSDWSASNAGSDTNTGVAYLVPGVWNYEFAITALNGDLESPMSDGLQAYYPGYTRGGGACSLCTIPQPDPNTPVRETSPSPLPVIPVIGGSANYKNHNCDEIFNEDMTLKDGKILWRALDVNAAWEEAVAFANKQKDVQFSQSIAAFFKATGAAATMDCLALNVDNGCADASFNCKDLNYPAGYVILNSMSNVASLLYQIYTSIKDASQDTWDDADNIAKTFNPTPPTDETALFILGIVENVFSMALAPGIGKALTGVLGEDEIEKAVEVSDELVDAGFAAVNEALSQPDNSVSTAESLQSQLKAMSTEWLKSWDSLNGVMFNGENPTILRKLIGDGAFLVRRGSGAFNMTKRAEKPIYAQLIPMAWSHETNDAFSSPSGVFILDSGIACKADDACPDYLDAHTTREASHDTCHCYKEKLYFLVQLTGPAEQHAAPPNAGIFYYGFSKPQALDKLTGERWGGVTLAKFIEGSVNTYVANGNKNGGYNIDFKDEKTMEALIKGESEDDITVPGVMLIPVCQSGEAWHNWDQYSLLLHYL
ncbi:hypothetical protein V495_02964 [Pseudogymnoascus sp. VKM F-4514 (FW-929)]|nr:hypothetical protein V495_02964 [Pseudogymnoascus sp. VKM F-4514 (FW-929)]KFY63947.1 hypothetical protein V497_01909 [Pseudogymnoascus sp. VKM F-4516 (FW-969)]